LTNIISVEQVNKCYGAPPHGIHALRDVSFSVQHGEVIGILGKSGAGKSTLINLLAGIDHPTDGKIMIMDNDFSMMSEDQLAIWRGLHIGVVYQTFQLLNQLSVLDNILIAMDLCGKYRERSSREKAMQILVELEIEDQAHKIPALLSGGQRQRAAIARALANDPPVLLADEPTGNLDSQTAEKIFSFFRQLAADGRTILIVTHDRSRKKDFSRILQLSDGEMMNEE